MRCRCIRWLLLVPVMLSFAGRAAWAQGGFAAQPSSLPPYWADLKWDARKRGPLLTVEPLPVRSAPDPRSDDRLRFRMPAPPQRGEQGYDLASLAEYFQWSTLAAGSVTAIGPREMVVLNTNLGEPNLLLNLSAEEKSRIMIGSLRPDQIRKMGSSQGLGAADLTPSQREIFAALLPDPLEIRRYRKHEQGGMVADGPTITLSAAQRAGVRIRLELSPRIAYPSLDRENAWATLNDGKIIPDEALGIEQVPYRPASLFGADLAPSIPNRLKRSQLDFASTRLNREIALAADSDAVPAGPLTVGEMVRRVAAASGLELYADVDVLGRPVYAKGDSARAGDVLKALCFALTATFRKVGPAYLLTDEVGGIGSRLALQREWVEDARARLSRLQFEADRVAKAADLGNVLQVSGGPLGPPLSPERMRQLPVNSTRYGRDGAEVDTTALNSAWQQRIRADAAEHNATAPQRFPPRVDGRRQLDPRIRDDRVRISLTVSMRYVVPGVGPVDTDVQGGSGFGISSAGPAGVEPESSKPSVPNIAAFSKVPVRVLFVSPATADEARRAVDAAAERGFTHLWAGCSSTGAALLKEAVLAGKSKGIKVSAVVALLFRDASNEAKRAAVTAYGDRALDVNILGETNAAFYKRRKNSAFLASYPGPLSQMANGGEWLRGDGESVAARLVEEMTTVARIEGLDELVLTRTAPPGYLNPGEAAYSAQMLGTEFGYGDDARLDFLRQHGRDPVDIVPSDGGLPSRLPFFSNGTGEGSRPLFGAWAQYRFEANRAFMARMYESLKAARPALRLMMDDRSPLWLNTSFFAEWDRPDVHRGYNVAPNFAGPYTASGFGAQAARVYYLRTAPESPVYRGLPMYPGVPQPDASPGAFARQVIRVLDTESRVPGGCQGIVADLSAAPLSKALVELEGFPRKVEARGE